MKIEEQVLSREQMAHLVELGVDTSDASMAWYMSPNTNQWKIKIKDKFAHEMLRRISPERYIPTYTIGDLEEKLPKIIGSKELETNFGIKNVGYWTLTEGIHSVNYKRYIDGLYNLLCWVVEKHKQLIK